MSRRGGLASIAQAYYAGLGRSKRVVPPKPHSLYDRGFVGDPTVPDDADPLADDPLAFTPLPDDQEELDHSGALEEEGAEDGGDAYEGSEEQRQDLRGLMLAQHTAKGKRKLERTWSAPLPSTKKPKTPRKRKPAAKKARVPAAHKGPSLPKKPNAWNVWRDDHKPWYKEKFPKLTHLELQSIMASGIMTPSQFERCSHIAFP